MRSRWLLAVIAAVAGCTSAGEVAPSSPTATGAVDTSPDVVPSVTFAAADSTVAVAASTSAVTYTPERPTLDMVAVVLCDDVPQRMSSDAELYTDESYQCTYGAEQIRIDLYGSADQQEAANQAVRDFYASSGDGRSLAESPLGCGDRWAFGVDFNETRDRLLVALNDAGIAATLC